MTGLLEFLMESYGIATQQQATETISKWYDNMKEREEEKDD